MVQCVSEGHGNPPGGKTVETQEVQLTLQKLCMHIKISSKNNKEGRKVYSVMYSELCRNGSEDEGCMK